MSKPAEDKINVAKGKIEALSTSMRRVNWYCHFTRNKPKWRTEFYYRFIYIMMKAAEELNDWERFPESLTREWNSARNSFDKMYGIVKALNSEEAICIIVNTINKEIKNNQPKEELEKEIKKLAEDMKKEFNLLKEEEEKKEREVIKRFQNLQAELEKRYSQIPEESDENGNA